MDLLIPVTKFAKSIVRKFGRRENGCFNIYTTRDEITSSISESPQAFPAILELAQLSQHAYTISDLNDDTEVPFGIEHMEDWTCIGTGRYSDGYCGAAYVNYKHSHVVIAHGGTEFIKEFYRDFICTDIGGIGLNKEVSQISSAYIFTKIIVNLCSETQFSISVTGHSLGGWLAQICAFYIAHPTYISQNQEVKKVIGDKQKKLNITDSVEIRKAYHLHTVSFDSPGCRRALKKIVGYYSNKAIEWRENVDTLDFTVIIAPSNSVNTCGEHVGYVLTLEMPGVKEVSWLSSHAIKSFVEHLSSPEPILKEVHDIYRGKRVQSEDECVYLNEWYIGSMCSCQVNIFSPKELTFLCHTHFILKWRDNESLESSKRKFKDINEMALKILDVMEQNGLKEFILHFNVHKTHNVIEFCKNILDESNLKMSELVRKLLWLLRVNRDWWTGDRSDIREAVRDLPQCRDMVCESKGSEYVKGIPKVLCCTTKNLCNRVRLFLENDQNVLNINASSDGNECRLCMVHLLHCFGMHCQDSFGEPPLFLNISSVQRLNMEIEMSTIFSQTKFGLIVVECDSEMNEEMNVVIRGMIASSERESKKLIIVTTGQDFESVKNRLLNGDDLTLQFENLDESSKQFISECPVLIHGNTFMLGKSNPPCGKYLLDNLDSFFSITNSSQIICEIFDGKIIDLSCGSLPIMAKHYIHRKLFQITLDVEILERNLKNFSDVLVVSNSDESIKTLIPKALFLNNHIHEADGEYKKEDFLNDCESKFLSKNLHWFKKEGSMFVWQMSNGQPCFDYLKTDEGEIRESYLRELQNNFIILADEPGMGKSAAITKLFLEYSDMHFNSIDSHLNWPVYIDLNNHQIELKNKTYSDYDSAISFLAKAMNLDGEFEKSLFIFCLKETGNVTLFIDSFDEISKMGQDFVVRMLQELKAMSHSKIRVWIATRNYAKYELENKLGTKSYKFHRVEEEAQIKFLMNYWTNGKRSELKENYKQVLEFAETFAERAIKAVQNILGTDNTFIGIPLQLNFLAVIYNECFLQLLEDKLRDRMQGTSLSLSDNDWRNYTNIFSSTLEMYDLFVEKKMNIWLEDKYQFKTRNDWMENTLRARMNKIHSQAAFSYVSSSILTNLDVNLEAESLSSDDSYEMNRVGVCEMSDEPKSNFRFYHQTIAEYYTAKYLVKLIARKKRKNEVVLFLKTHYYKPYFKKIRYFLDSLLCTTLAVSSVPVLKNLELLNTRESSREIESLQEHLAHLVWQDCVDPLGRNLLHYAMAYGDHVSGIFWIIGKGFSLFHKKDLLGETCLSYFCLSEGFPSRLLQILIKYLGYRKEIPAHENLGKIDKDFPLHIIGVQVLYSIFCGSKFEVHCIENDLKAMESNKSSGAASNDFITPFNFNASINRDMFLDFIKNTDVDQLTKNVEINMTWLSHCTENRLDAMPGFLERLCLHNSLDEKFENKLLNEWFETCLSEKADEWSIELGTSLIKACKWIDKLHECVLQILRTNLPHYYHNALPYVRAVRDEYDLWKSCTDINDKRKMLLVMKNHNFFSLARAVKTKCPLVKGVTDFVYRKSGGEFRGAMNEGLAKAFHVFIFSDNISSAFAVYDASDEEAKEQMIMENFEFQMSNVVHDKPKLSFISPLTILDIMEGRNNLWALRSLPIIMIRDFSDFQRRFFTFALLCDYPKECVPIGMSSD